MSVLHYTPKPWMPLAPAELLPQDKRTREREASEGGPPLADEIWMNDEYQVHVSYMAPAEGRDGVLSLSIKRTDGRPVEDWREKQAIKNEVLGFDREAVEVYPAESRLVDTANQCYLWAMPKGVSANIGFPERLVLTNRERIEHIEARGHDTRKGSQREWRPGLPTGANLNPEEDRHGR